VNVLGHTFVALAAGRDDPEWLLGAVLPDLAPMAGVRVARAGLDGELGEGVRCHLRADEVFHAHPAFRAGAGTLRRAAAERGVPRGAARAVGHAGWELLLDGALVGAETEAAFHRAVAVAGPSAATAMTDDDARRWAAFLERGARVGAAGDAPRLRYDEPRWVAERLHVMLARRPRLALPVADVPAVADVLAEHAGAVAAVAATVLDDTARATHTR
jgi:hypothetical protein